MKRVGPILTAVAALGIANWAFGQAMNSGDITGTVTDSTGAVVPGVSVTILDVDKGVTHTFVTNDAGAYDTGPIVPDHYLLTFAREGFETYKRGPITVGVGMLGINVQMTVGQASQQITVTTEAPLLETTTAEVSSTIESDTLTELPQTGGYYPDWANFIVLQPGATGTPQSDIGGAGNPGTESSANGSLPYLTGLMDGAYITSPMSDNVIATPVFDGIAEVKMSDSLFSAQYGLGGILYNQITKGGTNHYHGMAYDYLQNNLLNAKPWWFSGNPRPTVSVLHENDIGGNFGGHVPIPYIHKQLFLFFDVDRAINHGGASPTSITVPSDAMRIGDFTGMPTIYDPTTQVVTMVNGQPVVTRQSFASEYGNGNKIPAALISSVAQNLQKYFPTANVTSPQLSSTGVPYNNYSYVAQGTNFPTVKYLGRFDFDLTPSNRITGSASWNNFWLPGTGPACPADCSNTDVLSSLNQLTDVWTISNKVVNEFRMAFMEEHDLWTPQSLNKGIPAAAGLQFAKADEFPVIDISNTGFGESEYEFDPGTDGFYISNVLTPSDVVTLELGKHTLHFGGEDLIYRSDSTQGNLTPYGSVDPANLSFTGVYTASTQGASDTTGNPYADYLLGYSASWSALVAPEFGARQKIPQLFAQDDWKFNSKLTLNLGVRWGGTTGWSDIRGNVMSFDPTVTNPATNALGAMWYGVTHANGRTHLEQGKWDAWMPRIGFAYALGQKTTIRGGWGIYTFPWSFDDYGSGLGLALASSGSESDSTNGANPVVLLNSDGSTNYQGSNGASINSLYQNAPTGAGSYNGQGVNYTPYNTPWVHLQQWNFTVQRQLNSNLMGQVAYIGSHGGNLLFLTDKNQVPESELGPNDSSNRPYPEFQTISGNTTNGISNYHSLQGVITQRTKAGLFFTFNYVWSKFLDDQDTAGWNLEQGDEPFQNAYAPSANYGPSNFDVRQAFKGQVVYQLPFGKGRHFLNNSGPLDETIGGWELTGTLVSQTGSPFTPTEGSGVGNLSYSLSSNGSQYPDLVGNPKQSGASGTLNEWFNPAAFAAPTAGTFGDMRRNSVYGPDLKKANAALHKVFPISERVSLDVNINAQNFLNHQSFGQPLSASIGGIFPEITSTTVGPRTFELVGKLRF
jgi:hypothetical protein